MEATTAVTELIEGEMDDATSKIKKITKNSFSKFIEKNQKYVGPLLEVAGPLLGIVASFFPSGEEQLINQLMEEMRKEFKVLNKKIDKGSFVRKSK